MAEVLKLKVVTPNREFFEGEASFVELTTSEGNVGIYPEHIPMVAIVAPGTLKIHTDEGVKAAALMSGFLEIGKREITIMAEACEWPDEIDEIRAKEAEERARRRLANADAATLDIARAELSLKRSLVRQEIKNIYK